MQSIDRNQYFDLLTTALGSLPDNAEVSLDEVEVLLDRVLNRYNTMISSDDK